MCVCILLKRKIMRWFRVEVEWILNSRVTECSLGACSSFWDLSRNETQETPIILSNAQAPIITSEIRILFLNAQFCKSYNKNRKKLMHLIFSWKANCNLDALIAKRSRDGLSRYEFFSHCLMNYLMTPRRILLSVIRVVTTDPCSSGRLRKKRVRVEN